MNIYCLNKYYPFLNINSTKLLIFINIGLLLANWPRFESEKLVGTAPLTFKASGVIERIPFFCNFSLAVPQRSAPLLTLSVVLSKSCDCLVLISFKFT